MKIALWLLDDKPITRDYICQDVSDWRDNVKGARNNSFPAPEFIIENLEQLNQALNSQVWDMILMWDMETGQPIDLQDLGILTIKENKNE